MRILAIDAATRALGVAIAEPERLLATAGLNIGLTHSERLLPLTEQLLQSSGITAASLEAVAVTVGPGSFTGLRIGIATAKALAYAWQLPLIPVLTLTALAENARGYGSLVCPLLDARKNEVYYALYDEQGAELLPPAAAPPQVLAGELAREYPGRRLLLLGDGSEAYYEIFRAALGENVSLIPAARRFMLAESAALWAAVHPELATEPAAVQAFYLRLSEAEARRKAAENAGA